MAIESALSSAITMKLNAGVRQGSGSMIVRTVALGKVMHGAEGAKVMNCVGALLPVLAHPLFRVERRETTVLEN